MIVKQKCVCVCHVLITSRGPNVLTIGIIERLDNFVFVGTFGLSHREFILFIFLKQNQILKRSKCFLFITEVKVRVMC